MAVEFHKLNIREKRRETDDTVSLILEVPPELKDEFAYTQGQYLTLKFQINGDEVRRAYSMSSSPLEDELAVTVKRVPKGVVSSHIHERIREGDSIEVMPPEGRFYSELQEDQRKTYYLFGAGSGITPLMSILKTVLEREPKSHVFLLYGNRDEENIIFREQLDQLQQRYAGQLEVEYILSRPRRHKAKSGLSGLFSKGVMTWTGKVGRIDAEVARQFIEEHPQRGGEAEYFICGPGDMNLQLERSLQEQGIDKANIHVEHFSNIVPGEAPQAAASSKDEPAMARVEVTLDGAQIEVYVPKGKTVLDVLLDEGYDPPYSCTAGACSTCMAKVLQGSVTMDTCLALDEEEVQEGYILTCQSHPTSKELKITYDV